jgi:5-methylcytosine-specific restriction endonuclease McrA
MSAFFSNSDDRRRRKFERQGGICHWCKQPMTLARSSQRSGSQPSNFATFEHLQRKRDGGGGKPHNVVLACRKCNNLRERGQPGHHIPKKAENLAAIRSSKDELMTKLAAGTLNDAERGELYKRGLLPNWPMWSKLMAHVPLGTH